jgi:formate hydrogenlyase subunit 6/NADH:ubiquinone oxidoreductase subunit I
VDGDGNPVVNPEECRACGICVAACPREIIRMVPADSRVDVFCSSPDPGKVVVRVCPMGCIACGLCVKACPTGAITVENNLARIDYGKCVACGKCVEVCPRHIIKKVSGQQQAESAG